MRAPTEVRIVLTHPLKLACSEYLSRDAVFSIVPDDGSPRKFSGFIERFSTIQNTKDYVKYEIVLKSHFGRLAAVTRRNIFQQASTPDILHDHELREHQFHFCLRRPYPKPAFRIQHGMSDQNYAHMADQYRGNADNGALANGGFHFYEGQSGTNAGAVDRAQHRADYDELLDTDA